MNTPFYTSFIRFDANVANFLNGLLHSYGQILTPIALFFDVVGEVGALGIIVGLILCLFAKTRRMGVCMLFSIALGALATNIILKDLIARPRPFEAYEVFKNWWIEAGSHEQGGYSFPSGHVTSAASAAFGFCAAYFASGLTAFRQVPVPLNIGKKKLRKSPALLPRKRLSVGLSVLAVLCALIYVFVMAFSRCYIVVHYASDTVAGMIIGLVCAPLGLLLTVGLYRFFADDPYTPSSQRFLHGEVFPFMRRKKDRA